MTAIDTGSQAINTTEIPQQVSTLAERTNQALLKIIRNNFDTQYATQAPSLSRFREAVSAHGSTGVDALLADFRSHVPLSDYGSYKPFMDKFNMQPCKKEEVENLLAPGLPDFIATTSGPSGLTPKLVPKYDHHAGEPLPRCPFLDPTNEKPIAAVICFGHEGIREIEHEQGQVVQRIPLCIVSGGRARRCFGWKFNDDESRMSLKMPFYVVPWAATIISHLPSFLTIHSLFFLARRDVGRFYVPFTSAFIDLMRNIDEQWDMFVSCIRDGVLPDLEGIDHVREHLQAQIHADPERAAELTEIGPPFSLEGWGARVWPKANELVTRYTGIYNLVLPKIKHIMGPHIRIRLPPYGATEGRIGAPHTMDKLEEFILLHEDIVEFLDISQDETHENIRQVWEVEVGKQYEPILTTRDGIWRYQVGDILSIVGFSPEYDSPIFKYAGRKSSTIRLQHAQITENQLLEAIKAINSEDTITVQEYTTVVDDRTLPPTVGLFIELAWPLGPNAHLAPQNLFDALVASDAAHGQIRLPTIRIVKTGTFGEYRSWRAKMRNTASAQIKAPMVIMDPTVREWVLERVIQEL